MKNNYPIRYVALPLSENGRWQSDEGQDRGIICYLVIKCYVVGEETKYFREGKVSKEYKVVPTYGTTFPHIFQMTEPKYDIDDYLDYENIKYTNYLCTKNVFEKLEDAEKYRDDRNKEIDEIVVSAAPKWANLKEKFKKTIEKFRELEEDFEENTKELPTDERKKHKQNIYGIDNAMGLVEEDISAYSLIDEGAYTDHDYAVYTITEEEAKELEQILKNDALSDEFIPKKAKKYMHTPLMMHKADSYYVKLVSPEGESKIVKMEETPLSINLDVYLDTKKEINFDGVLFEEFFFTLETYDDIVEAFNLDEKRKRGIVLGIKPSDIWTNDKYKY